VIHPTISNPRWVSTVTHRFVLEPHPMNMLTHGLKRFERHWIRPLVRRVRSRPQQVDRADWPPECDRLEELLVALLRAELRERRTGERSSELIPPPANSQKNRSADELDGLLEALLETSPIEQT